MPENSKKKDQNAEPQKPRYNLRKSLSLKNSYLMNVFKRRQDVEIVEAATTKGKKGKKEKSPPSEKKKEDLPKITPAKQKAILKIVKQQEPQDQDKVVNKKTSFKARLARSMSMSMSTPKKTTVKAESPKLSPIVLAAAAAQDEEKKGSPPKKQKTSPTGSVELYPLAVQEELKRKIPVQAVVHTPVQSSSFKLPVHTEAFKENYLMTKASVLPAPLTRQNVGRITRRSARNTIDTVRSSPIKKPQFASPAKPNELSSLPDIGKSLSLDFEADFAGFSDDDIPADIAELTSYFLQQESTNDAQLVPINKMPPLVPIERQPAPSAIPVPVAGSSSAYKNVNVVIGNVIVRPQAPPILSSMPLKVIHNNGQNVPTKVSPKKADKEIQTENQIRKIFPDFLLANEPIGTIVRTGYMKTIFDTEINAFKYTLIDVNLNGLSLAQHHSAQLQLRHQVHSYEVFDDPRAGDLFPINVVVNLDPSVSHKFIPILQQ